MVLGAFVAQAQLKPNEKEGVIYLYERGGFKRDVFRYNGATISNRQTKKLLLGNPDSGPLMQKALRKRRIGLITAFGGLGFTLAAIPQSSSGTGPRNDGAERRAPLFLTIGILGTIAGEVVVLSGSRDAYNALRLFNKETMAASPAQQAKKVDTAGKILYNVGGFGSRYYYQGKTIGVRRLDELLGQSTQAQPFYQLMQRNKKLSRMAGIATGATAVLVVITGIPFDKDIDNRSNATEVRFFVSMGAAAVALTTWGVANRRVREHRYNAYRLFNNESPLPFNRRTQRLIDRLSVSLGTTPHGVGMLVHL